MCSEIPLRYPWFFVDHSSFAASSGRALASPAVTVDLTAVRNGTPYAVELWKHGQGREDVGDSSSDAFRVATSSPCTVRDRADLIGASQRHT